MKIKNKLLIEGLTEKMICTLFTGQNREGKWNGGFAPYGRSLIDGK